LGSGLCVLGLFGGIYAVSAASLCIAGLSIPGFIRPRSKITSAGTAVRAHQRILRHPLFWWTLLFGLVAVFMWIDVADGDAFVRPVALAVVFTAAVPALVVLAIRKRGRIEFTPHTVHFAGKSIRLDAAHVDIFLNGQAPIIRVRQHPAPDGTSGPRVLITPRPFGLDPNTLASTLTQMVEWLDEGREASPDEILAMLTVDPPQGVPVGDSVAIPFTPSASASGRTLRR
jgi:hypothetical protein